MVTVIVHELCNKTREDGHDVARGQDETGSCGFCAGIVREKF